MNSARSTCATGKRPGCDFEADNVLDGGPSLRSIVGRVTINEKCGGNASSQQSVRVTEL